MTPYSAQWNRIKELYKQGRIPAAEMKALAARHRRWFDEQHRQDATVFMTQDVKAYADHIEEFGNKTAGGSEA